MRWTREALVAALVLGGAGRASAFVRSQTEAGATMCWARSSISLTLAAGASGGQLQALDRDSMIAGARAAADAWNNATAASGQRCTQLQLSINVSDDARADATQDEDNRISFRQDEWKREPCDPMKEMNCNKHYDPTALAITSTYAHTRSGQIVGGDVELNGINFTWADLVRRPELQHMGYQDFQNALTHELGHFIGLDHTCFMAGNKRLNDNQGQPQPLCGVGVSADIRATTMYASADPGDISKRDLAPDDIQAVCTLFPAGGSLACADDSQSRGGCALAGGRGGAGALGVVAALGVVLGLRRRRRR